MILYRYNTLEIVYVVVVSVALTLKEKFILFNLFSLSFKTQWGKEERGREKTPLLRVEKNDSSITLNVSSYQSVGHFSRSNLI